MGFQFGFGNILMATNASTDLLFWSKEINISDTKESKNMNWSTSGEHTPLILMKIFNTRSIIHPDKDKLFSQKKPNF